MQDEVLLRQAREAATAELALAARQVLVALKPVPTADQILADIATASRDSDVQVRSWDSTGTPPLPIETMLAGAVDRPPVAQAALRELARALPHVPADLIGEALRASRLRQDVPTNVNVSTLTRAELASILLRVIARDSDVPWPKLLAARRLRRLALDIPTDQLLAWLKRSAGMRGFWPLVRAEVVGLVGEAGRDVPLGTFKTLQQEGSPPVEAAAARALLARGVPFSVDYFFNLWRRLPPSVESEDVYAALASFGRSGVNTLVNWAHSDKVRDRANAFWGLAALSARVPKDWVPDDPFLVGLADSSPEIRAVAVRAAAEIGRRSLLGPVARALEDVDKVVRRAALAALVRNPGSAPTGTLAATLTGALNDASDAAREDVLKLAWRLGKDAPTEAMIQMLGDTNADIRAAAAEALNRTHADALHSAAEAAAAILDGKSAVPPFDSIVQSTTALTIAQEPHPNRLLLDHAAALLAWPYWEVRMYAARALRPPPPPESVPQAWVRQLEALAGDPDFPGVQEAARNALERLRNAGS